MRVGSESHEHHADLCLHGDDHLAAVLARQLPQCVVEHGDVVGDVRAEPVESDGVAWDEGAAELEGHARRHKSRLEHLELLFGVDALLDALQYVCELIECRHWVEVGGLREVVLRERVHIAHDLLIDLAPLVWRRWILLLFACLLVHTPFHSILHPDPFSSLATVWAK